MSALARGSIFAGDFEITSDEPLSGADGSGRGVVYAAYQVSTAKRCVLEVMHAPLAADPEARERFVREATPSSDGAPTDEAAYVAVLIAAGVDEATLKPWIATQYVKAPKPAVPRVPASAEQRPAAIAAPVPALTSTAPHKSPPEIATRRLPLVIALLVLLGLAAIAMLKAMDLSLGSPPIPFEEDVDAAPLPQVLPAGPTMPDLPSGIFESPPAPPFASGTSSAVVVPTSIVPPPRNVGD